MSDLRVERRAPKTASGNRVGLLESLAAKVLGSLALECMRE